MIVAHVGRLVPYLGDCSGRAALRRGQCYILGFPGNATMKQTLPRNNEKTCLQQCNRGVTIGREVFQEQWS
jgi:hypothetical protein